MSSPSLLAFFWPIIFLSASAYDAYQLYYFFNAGLLPLFVFQTIGAIGSSDQIFVFIFVFSISLGVRRFAMEPTQAQPPLAVSRQNFLRPQSAQDWENQKAKVKNLDESNELRETMKIMEEQHGFKAT